MAARSGPSSRQGRRVIRGGRSATRRVAAILEQKLAGRSIQRSCQAPAASDSDWLYVKPPEVHGHHVVEGRVAAAPHLPVAGEAGLDGQAAHGALVVLGHLGGERRARAHAGELAHEAVQELRELVYGVLADELADPRHARVVLDLEQRAVGLVEFLELGQALVGVLVHAPELVHVERSHLAAPPDAPDALLGVDGAARGLQADGDAQDDRGDQQHGYRAQRERDVERPLHEAVSQPPLRRRGDGHGALGLRHQLGRQERHVGGGHRLGIPDPCARLYITALIVETACPRGEVGLLRGHGDPAGSFRVPASNEKAGRSNALGHFERPAY